MKKGHRRDTTPELLSIDAALALSRKAIKQSLDLNLPRSHSTCRDSKDIGGEELRRELVAAREELMATKLRCQELTEGRARGLEELEDVAKTLRRELRRKNEEVNHMVALLEKAEYKEKQLTNALSKLTQDHNSLLVRTASERKTQEDSNFDLKSAVSRLERQVGDLSSRLEQACTQQSTLASKLQTSETTNSRLNAELTQVNSALASTKLKLHSAEDAQASLQRQIKEITEAHARVLVDSSQLPRLDAQIRGMEATQTQQVAFNLQLQEDVRRLQRENEALKRAKAEDLKAAKDQVSHQAAKFAAQIDSLEAQLQRHLDSDQENRGRLVASMLDSKSSLLLKTHRTKR